MKSIKIGVGLIIKNINSNKILIAKSPKVINGWTIPGGHLEFGERIKETAKREAREEIGLNVIFEKILRVCEVVEKKADKDIFHMISFHVLCFTKDDVCKIDNREIVETRWVDIDSAINMVEFVDFKKSLLVYKDTYGQ